METQKDGQTRNEKWLEIFEFAGVLLQEMK